MVLSVIIMAPLQSAICHWSLLNHDFLTVGTSVILSQTPFHQHMVLVSVCDLDHLISWSEHTVS